VSARRFAIIVILALSFGSPIVEMFDQWDHTAQDGNDTEANVVIAALCVGISFSIAGIAVGLIRAAKSTTGAFVVSNPPRLFAASLPAPAPNSSPPTPLRV
jgi:hypothetical protein